MFKSKKKGEKDPYSFTFQPKPLQQAGAQSIQEMSLIKAQYLEYLVLENGVLVAALSSTGINLELFNEQEQSDIFEDYAAFLISHFSGNTTNESIQTLDMTVPVDLNPYLLAWKKRYLDALETGDIVKQNLIASYIDHYESFNEKSEMTTKEHIIVISEPMKDQRLESLERASRNLDEKVDEFRRSLENTFSNYDVDVRKLDATEYKTILYWFMNFNHK